MTNKIADVEFPYLPPWRWVFTKKEADKWNPINKGDSGGPVLISKNGEWIVYGVKQRHRQAKEQSRQPAAQSRSLPDGN
jgi:hypothetical protein